jgi:hypothetical protein
MTMTAYLWMLLNPTAHELAPGLATFVVSTATH